MPIRNGKLYKTCKTRFGNVVIEDRIFHGEEVRMFLVNDGQESACYYEDGRHYDLIFNYTKKLARLYEMLPGQSTLLLGGAGFSIPKYILSRYPDRTVDVVEICEEFVDLARQYFFLDELLEDVSLNARSRLRIFIEDANLYFRSCSTRYDIIINDAFRGTVQDKGLLSDRRVAEVRSCLSPGGIYIVNMITARRGYNSMGGILEYEILRRHFRDVTITDCHPDRSPTEKQNCLLIATDDKRITDIVAGSLNDR